MKILTENREWQDISDEGQKIWLKLGDINTSENEDGDTVIDTDFLHFPKGTNREEIWLWFESKYDCIVGNIL